MFETLRKIALLAVVVIVCGVYVVEAGLWAYHELDSHDASPGIWVAGALVWGAVVVLAHFRLPWFVMDVFKRETS